jgi:carnitine-CoA ligase
VIDTEEAPPHVEVNLADTMSILYTSGTTGPPKGCVLSHGYYGRAGRVVSNALELTSTDVLYTAMPLFHAGARLLVLNAALLRGLPAIIDPAFSARRFLPRAAEIGATVVIGVGSCRGEPVRAVRKSPASEAASSLSRRTSTWA